MRLLNFWKYNSYQFPPPLEAPFYGQTKILGWVSTSINLSSSCAAIYEKKCFEVMEVLTNIRYYTRKKIYLSLEKTGVPTTCSTTIIFVQHLFQLNGAWGVAQNCSPIQSLSPIAKFVKLHTASSKTIMENENATPDHRIVHRCFELGLFCEANCGCDKDRKLLFGALNTAEKALESQFKKS